jgi:5-methylcytosine-specific restriction endonuclease McrA
MRIICQNYRSRKRANGGTLSKGLAEKLFKLQQGKCPCCKQPLGRNYHLDHIVPTALGGSNSDDNMQLLRATCNHQKHAKHPIDFMQQRGFLL